MHNDVDPAENSKICNGNNPFVTMILGGPEGPEERRFSKVNIQATQEDIILATNVCKAHLQQIEDLTHENKRIYNQFEALQQEHFSLRRQSQISDECNNSLIYELQAEISGFRDCAKQNVKQQTALWDIESSTRESELREQVQKQSKLLMEAAEKEAELRKEMIRMKQNYKREKDDVDEHLDYIQSLKEEISQFLQKKSELEKHINELVFERDNLSDSLDFSVGKIFSLERRQRDQENLLRSSEREIDELRTFNHHLMEKLEAWSVSRSSSPSCRTSINLELELSASDSDLSLYRSKNFHTINEEEEYIEEYDSSDIDTSELTYVIEQEESQLKKEVTTACQQLQKMSTKLRNRKGKTMCLDLPCTKFTLNETVEELNALIFENILSSNHQTDATSQTGYVPEEKDLECELSKKNRELAGSRIKMKELELAIEMKDLKIGDKNRKLKVLEARLNQVENERTELKTCFEAFVQKKQHKVKEILEESPQNTVEEDDKPTAVMTTINGTLYNHLEKIEEHLIELLATKDKNKLKR